MPFDLVTPLPAILPKKIIKDMGEITENTHTHTHTEHKIHLVKIKKKIPSIYYVLSVCSRHPAQHSMHVILFNLKNKPMDYLLLLSSSSSS